jgi:hypothetical protein
MTAPLTPPQALAHLHELSVDVRAAVVLDAAGEPVAGDAALAARARALLDDDSPVCAGPLLVARTPDGGAIAVLAGDFALVPLLRHDLAAVAAALATAPADLPGSRDSPC